MKKRPSQRAASRTTNFTQRQVGREQLYQEQLSNKQFEREQLRTEQLRRSTNFDKSSFDQQSSFTEEQLHTRAASNEKPLRHRAASTSKTSPSLQLGNKSSFEESRFGTSSFDRHSFSSRAAWHRAAYNRRQLRRQQLRSQQLSEKPAFGQQRFCTAFSGDSFDYLSLQSFDSDELYTTELATVFSEELSRLELALQSLSSTALHTELAELEEDQLWRKQLRA